MTTTTILVLAAMALLVFGAVFVFATTRSRDRAAAVGALSRETRKSDRSAAPAGEGAKATTGKAVERAAALERTGTLVEAKPAPPAVRAPLEPDAYGVTRRQFFNRGITALFALGLTGFSAQTIAFLWPSLSGGFGSKIKAGKLSEILREIADTKEPVYVPEGRFYVNPFPSDGVSKAANHYSGEVLGGMEQGVVALYQKCVHLGCRVPWCESSRWFECPCHGSRYNRWGEYRFGPAPRGLDRFAVFVEEDRVIVDTSTVVTGPSRTGGVLDQTPEGPHCNG